MADTITKKQVVALKEAYKHLLSAEKIIERVHRTRISKIPGYDEGDLNHIKNLLEQKISAFEYRHELNKYSDEGEEFKPKKQSRREPKVTRRG